MREMNTYETEARTAIANWKTVRSGPLENLTRLLVNPIGPVAGWVMKGPVGEQLGALLTRTLHVINDAATWSIDEQKVFAKFDAGGLTRVRTRQDIHLLDLQTIDGVVGRLDVGYVLAGVAEGAVTGVEGGLGLVLDVPLILGINLRMIADYATHYGFDAGDPVERAYALGVLDFALAGNVASKQAALDHLDEQSQAVARGGSASELRAPGRAATSQTLANSIAQRMAKGKLGQLLPVAGAVVGAGFNGWFTHGSCDAAFYLYRERFLERRLRPAKG